MAISLLACALLYCVTVYHWFGFYLGDQSIPYFFYASLFTVRLVLGLCLIPLIIGMFLIAFVMFIMSEQGKPKISGLHGLVYGLGVFILLIANVFACAATFPGFLSGGALTQYKDVQLGAHVYRLDSLSAGNGPSPSTADFELWQCDGLGLICSQIHDEDVSSYMSQTDTENATAHLIVGANSISMQINGKVVYVYTIQ